MSSTRVAATPAWVVVLRKQMRLVTLKRRRDLVLLGGAAGLASFLRLTDAYGAESVTFARFFVTSPLFPLTTFLALLWPGAVWSGEGPGERAYHWSLPVARSVHDLTRVGVGGACYLGVVSLGLGVGLLAVAVGWGRATPVTGVRVPAAAALALVLAYLTGTVPALSSAHPYRWVLGTYVGGALALSLSEVLARRQPSLARLHETLRVVTAGEYGLVSAFEAPVRLAAGGSGGADGSPWACLLLWLGVAAAATVATSSLHLERARGAAE